MRALFNLKIIADGGRSQLGNGLGRYPKVPSIHCYDIYLSTYWHIAGIAVDLFEDTIYLLKLGLAFLQLVLSYLIFGFYHIKFSPEKV